MMKILVCWEDRFHEKLDLCLRRALKVQAGSAFAAGQHRIFFVSAFGHGGFSGFIQQDWPRAAVRGLLKTGGAIDALICVADADRASECCGIERPPPSPAVTADWVERANHRWTQQLRDATDVKSNRVFGRFLRWSQESLVIATHDIDAALRRLGCRDIPALRSHLATCTPSPSSLPDERFTDCYRKPGKCLDELLIASQAALLKKGDPAREDALEEASRTGILRLCARVTDLASLSSLIAGLPADCNTHS